MSHIKTDLTSEQEYHSEHHRLTLELLLPSYTHVVVIQDTPFDLQHYNNTPAVRIREGEEGASQWGAKLFEPTEEFTLCYCQKNQQLYFD